MIYSKAKVSPKRQITIPIRIIKKLGINAGDSIKFDEIGEKVEIKTESSSISALDLPKLYGNISQKQASQEEIDLAREKTYSQRVQK